MPWHGKQHEECFLIKGEVKSPKEETAMYIVVYFRIAHGLTSRAKYFLPIILDEPSPKMKPAMTRVNCVLVSNVKTTRHQMIIMIID